MEIMSEKEKAIQLLNIIDDEKMSYVVGILENLTYLAYLSLIHI